jgi:hypothetical protein
MQLDWIEFRKARGDLLAAFVATLGWSRASFVRFVDNECVETLIECHAGGVRQFWRNDAHGTPDDDVCSRFVNPGADPHATWCGRGRFDAGPDPIRRHLNRQLHLPTHTHDAVHPISSVPERARYSGDVEVAAMLLSPWADQGSRAQGHARARCIVVSGPFSQYLSQVRLR